jgi:diguanylate cyclase (GGDEF)-like protein/PAS domain S-box-containing protein
MRQLYDMARYSQPILLLGYVAMMAVSCFADGYDGGAQRGWPFRLLLIAAALAVAAVVAWQIMCGRRYRRAGSGERSDPRWQRRLRIALAAEGLLWAAVPLCMLPVQPVFEAVVVISVALVMYAALPTVAVDSVMFYTFVLPQLAALLVVYGTRGDPAYAAMAVVLLLDLLFVFLLQRDLRAKSLERAVALLRNDALVTQLQRSDAALKRSLAEHQVLFDVALVGIAEIRDRKIVRTNAQLEQMLGYDADAMLGLSPVALYPADSHLNFSEFAEPLSRGVTFERDMQVRRRDGSVMWVQLACRAIDAADPALGVIAVLSDITDRREREAAMQRLAHEDSLTGLPNRRMLEDRTRIALLRARRRGNSIALLLIDLDGFKKVNDNLGHDVGDEVLKVVARRLVACVRACDTVCRLGGDEFVVLLDDPARPEDAQQVAQKLVAAASDPIRIGDHVIGVGASIGISVAPHNGDEIDALLRCADEAMYRAKQSGRGAWRLCASGSAAA